MKIMCSITRSAREVLVLLALNTLLPIYQQLTVKCMQIYHKYNKSVLKISVKNEKERLAKSLFAFVI